MRPETTSSRNRTAISFCACMMSAIGPLLPHRFVVQQDIPVAEHPCLGELQRETVFHAFEHGLSLPDDHGVQQDLIFVDQTLLSQLRYDAAASEHGQVLPRSLLQFLDL